MAEFRGARHTVKRRLYWAPEPDVEDHVIRQRIEETGRLPVHRWQFAIEIFVAMYKQLFMVVPFYSSGMETDQASVDANVTSQQFEYLPLKGRKFISIAALAPRVATCPQANINPGDDITYPLVSNAF